jgi:hypothetical protein
MGCTCAKTQTNTTIKSSSIHSREKDEEEKLKYFIQKKDILQKIFEEYISDKGDKLEDLLVSLLRDSSRGPNPSYYDEVSYDLNIVNEISKLVTSKHKMVQFCCSVYFSLVNTS